ncbi:MAG: hypothetical protein Q4C91_01320, partial [Eubacteriales bacterium]|nr:hypothetical protein [Eubacteriales bacterium]
KAGTTQGGHAFRHVKKYENGRVHTVEGNSGDAVRQEIYLESSASILGYGVCEASYNLGKSLI